MSDSELSTERMPDGTLLLSLAGEWKLGRPLPTTDRLFAELAAGTQAGRIGFATGRLAGWDSGLLIFLARLFENCRRSDIGVDTSGLPDGVRKLLALAAPENQRSGVSRETQSGLFLVRDHLG